jgi:KAP-like P-loop domain-containing protein
LSDRPGNAVQPLLDGELVDDRALDALEADKFSHGDFVKELAGVICKTNTPASIALFGPWGSGKSGIANVLQEALPRDRRQLRFVTFDASKYAEAPLRRHFISQVAYGLDNKQDVSTFAASAEHAWQVVAPLAHDQIPPKTYTALSDFARRLPRQERFELIDSAIERAVATDVHRSFFEAAHLSEAPAAEVADRLVALSREKPTPEGWRALMRVWQQLNPTEMGVRRMLAEELYLPLIASGDEGLDTALSQFGLVASIDGVRRSVREALRAAAHTEEQQRRIDERLLEAKWTRKSLFGLGPARDEG